MTNAYRTAASKSAPVIPGRTPSAFYRKNAPRRRMLQASAPILIRSVDQLRALPTDRLFRTNRPVVLELPGMAADAAFVAGEQLNALRAECGCSLGAKAMTVGFGLAFAVTLLRHGLLTLATLERMPIVVALAAVSAALGKGFGVAWARRRARRELRRILNTFVTHP